jgi:hypothetical protein
LEDLETGKKSRKEFLFVRKHEKTQRKPRFYAEQRELKSPVRHFGNY